MRVVRFGVAILLGLVLTEAGLRVRFPEVEADRLYWGRGAFAPREGFAYGHARGATAMVSRPGRFAHPIATNALGFRDARLPKDAPDSPRIVVAGASFAFGLGVPDPSDLFHVQLERDLRARADWPDDLVVFNVSQSGYTIVSVSRLVRATFGTFRPEAVVELMSNGFGPQRHDGVDIVDGYRLPRARRGAGTILDRFRVGSYTWMRSTNPFAGAWTFHRRRLGLRVPPEPNPNGTPDEIRERLGVYREMMTMLRREGVPLFAVPVGGARGIVPVLRQMHMNVIELPRVPAWTTFLPDLHWNARGHREAAAIVARRLPPYRAIVEAKRRAQRRRGAAP